MYQIITRTSDRAVMDCRLMKRANLSYIVKTQIIPNHGGDVEDYEITYSETAVEPSDLRTTEAKWASIREKRDELLDLSDKSQVPDRPISAEGKAAWAAYRQLLRDLPQTYIDPDQVVWPTSPED